MVGIVKKGCTEIKLKKIQNVYRKYFAFNEYDEDKSQIYPDKVQHVYDQLECDGHAYDQLECDGHCHCIKFQSHKQAEE